jgi:hypothetical protein
MDNFPGSLADFTNKRFIECAGEWIGNYINVHKGHVYLQPSKVLNTKSLLNIAVAGAMVSFTGWQTFSCLLESSRSILLGKTSIASG